MYRFNLMPKAEKKGVNITRMVVTVVVIAMIALLVFIYFYNQNLINMLQIQITGLAGEIALLQPSVHKTEELQREISNLQQKDFYDEIFFQRFSWAEAIKEFSHLLPDRMRLERVVITPAGEITIEGETVDHERVYRYMSSLYQSPFFDEVKLGQSISSWQAERRVTRFNVTMVVAKGGSR